MHVLAPSALPHPKPRDHCSLGWVEERMFLMPHPSFLVKDHRVPITTEIGFQREVGLQANPHASLSLYKSRMDS